MCFCCAEVEAGLVLFVYGFGLVKTRSRCRLSGSCHTFVFSGRYGGNISSTHSSGKPLPAFRQAGNCVYFY